jgi:hypothetical protein
MRGARLLVGQASAIRTSGWICAIFSFNTHHLDFALSLAFLVGCCQLREVEPPTFGSKRNNMATIIVYCGAIMIKGINPVK